MESVSEPFQLEPFQLEPFQLNHLIAKPVPKKRDNVVVKICRKTVMEDDVFDERIVEQEPFLIDKRNQHLMSRSDIMNRLQKLMNGLSVDELVLPVGNKDESIETKLNKYFSSSSDEDREPSSDEQEPSKEKEPSEEPDLGAVQGAIEVPEQKKRITKKQKALQEGIQENLVVFSNDLYKDITKPKKIHIHKAPTYYMANRRMFIQKLNSLFKVHAEELSKIDDANVSCDKRSTEEFETLTHQKVVSDYLNLYSPYRGLLIFHGLGSGKTCTSITLAEGMKSEKKIVIMTPASLKSNFFSELKKCGDEVFRKNQNWVKTKITGRADAIKLNKLTGLDIDDILNAGIWLGTKNTDKGKKFGDLSTAEQAEVDAQLDKMIRSKYIDINYNGINANIMNKLTDNGAKNPFDNCVVIVDEAHNLVSRIVNKLKSPDSIAYQLYDFLMSAQNAKLVFLSGTPIINYPNEIAILFNMLRGYIKTWTIPINVKTANKINKETVQRLFDKEGLNTYDYMEYSGNKLIITRNPFGFINVHKASKSSDNPADTYNGITLDETGNISDIRFKERVIDILNTNDLEVEKSKVKLDYIKALPDDTESFLNMFIDPESGNMNNVDLLKRRVLGLTSYFKSAQEKLLPKYDKNRDFKIIRCEMSDHQLAHYSLARKEERDKDKVQKRKAKIDKGEFEMASTYRIYSRELCNFVFPEEYPRPTKKFKGVEEASVDEMDMDNDNRDIIVESDADYATKIKKALEYLKENGDKYLSNEGLLTLSPKFLHLLENLEDPDNEGLHLVYSQFRTIEGIGVLKLILEHNGFAEFKLVKKGDDWDIKDSDANEATTNKPHFVLYTGTESAEEKEIIRNVYNSNWSVLSNNIRSKLEKISPNNFMGEIIKVFMITSSGAEGINLENTRFVHIAEPYWHPVRMEQVIGRAKRICSHRNLPEHLRNIQVYLYLSVLSEEQIKNERNIELRTKDVSRVDRQTPVTTDEYLFELANTKEQINKQILNAVKETAMDCALYKSDSKDLVCYTFGKVSSNEFSTVPILEQDATQHAEMNVKKQKMTGVIVEIMGKKYIAKATNDKNAKEIYDIDTKDYVGKAILENKHWRLE